MSSQNTPPTQSTAAMLAIGDELLNGRTRDSNMHYLAQWLEERGIELREVRFVPDEEDMIIEAINALRRQYDMIFTSGGIGPTHDDITVDAISHAFGVEAEEHEEALKFLTEWYAAKGQEVTDARRRMARTPKGASLITNEVSGAPGIRIENVYILAGVPQVFTAMLDALDPHIQRGPTYTVYTVVGSGGESTVSEGLEALQIAIKGLHIGSYPRQTDQGWQLSIVCKAFDPSLARQGALAVEGLFRAQGVNANIIDGFEEQQG
ncbi:MAG: competence/damage-inducible protein A [Pseudomonadota bacterium]